RAALVVLGLQEVREHIAPPPPLEAHRRPGVIVGRVAADVDHRVDRGGPAEGPATREHSRAVAEARLGIADETPVVFAEAERELAGREMDLLRAVRRARL